MSSHPPAGEENFSEQNFGGKILSGGIWRVVGFAVSTLTAVVSTAVVSRVVGPADFAAFTTAFSLITISLSLSDFGLVALGVREFSLYEGEERQRRLRVLITARLALSIVSSAAIVAYAAFAGFPSDQVAGIAAASVGLVAFSLYVSYNVPIQATYRLRLLAILDTARQALHSTLIIVAALASGEVGVIVGVFLPASVVMTVWSATIARKYGSILPLWDAPRLKHLLADVGAFAIAASVGTIYIYVGQIVANHALSGTDAGEFALAFRVFAVMIGACMTAVSGAFPLLVTSAKEDRERLAYAARRLFQTVMLAALAGTVGLVTGASFVAAVLGGSAFDGAIAPIQVISIGLVASFVLITSSQVLLASGHHRQLIVVSVVGAILSVIATWALASQYGTTGAAAGIALGETLLAMGYIVVVVRVDRRLFPGLRWQAGALFSAAAGCSVALIGLPGLPAAILGLVVMAAFVLVLRLAPPELLAHVPGLGGGVDGD